MIDLSILILSTIGVMIVSILYLFLCWLLGWKLVKNVWPKAPWHVQISLGMGLGVVIIIFLLDILVGIWGWWGHLLVGVLLILNFVWCLGEMKNFSRLLTTGFVWARSHWTLVLLMFITTLGVWMGIAGSGWLHPGGYGYQPGIMRDSLWHLGLIKALGVNNPPLHPSTSTQVLSNYHYLYDLWLANWQFLTRINVQDLYFRVSTLFVLGFVSLSSLSLVRLLVHRRPLVFAHLWLVILWWSGSLSFLIPVFLPGVSWGESSFWVSQTFVMLVNPQFLLSLGLLSCLFILSILPLKYDQSKSSWAWWSISVAGLLYVLAGVKFFGVVFGVVWTGLILLYYLWKKKLSLTQFVAIGSVCVVTGIVILWRFVDFSSSSMIWAPLWFVTSMVAADDRLPVRDWVLREQHYRAVGAWHYLFILKAIETVIFYMGNFGVRSLGVLIGIVLWLNHKSLKPVLRHSYLWLVIFFLAIFSSILPLLFLQHGVVWNSIQYWYYTLFFADILLTGVLGYWWISSGRSLISKVMILLLILITSLMFFIHTTGQLKWSESITVTDLKLSQLISDSDTLVVCPQIENSSLLFNTSFFSVFSSARVTLIDPLMIQVIGQDANQQVSKLQNVFQSYRGDDLVNHLSPFANVILCNKQNFIGRPVVNGQVFFNDDKFMMIRVYPYCQEKYATEQYL